MGTFNKVANLNDSIFFQRGIVTTTNHWTRPSYQKVYDFLFNLYVKSMIIKEYDVYLMGGVLFDFNTTWDVDICLVGGTQTNEKLEEDLNYMTDLSLNTYNMLLDVTWYENRPENLIYDNMVENDFLQQDMVHKKIGYIKKQIGDDIQELDLKTYNDTIVLTEHLIQRNYGTIKHTDKMINKVQNNPNPITITTFSVNEFLSNNEYYFLNNTNR
jgi:hypothetical protein